MPALAPKRKAADVLEELTPTTVPKQPKIDRDTLAEFSLSAPLEKPIEGQTGSLNVFGKGRRYEHYASINRVDVYIMQKLDEDGSWTPIGEMDAWLVTKEAPQVRATRAKEPRWVVELLESDEKFKADETKDVRSVTRMLYRDNDQVKEQIAKHAGHDLACDKFICIDSFKIEEAHRKEGVGEQALRMFLGLTPQIIGRKAGSQQPSALCMFCFPRSEGWNFSKRSSDVDVEDDLIDSLDDNGFETWWYGFPTVERNLSVMGRVV